MLKLLCTVELLSEHNQEPDWALQGVQKPD